MKHNHLWRVEFDKLELFIVACEVDEAMQNAAEYFVRTMDSTDGEYTISEALARITEVKRFCVIHGIHTNAWLTDNENKTARARSTSEILNEAISRFKQAQDEHKKGTEQ